MLKLTNNSVLASEIADWLGKALHGDDMVVYEPAHVGNLKNNAVVFVETNEDLGQVSASGFNEILVLTAVSTGISDELSVIQVDNPEMVFIDIVENFFTREIEHKIHQNANIEKGAELGKNVLIASGCHIGPDVKIGDNTIVLENTVIKGHVVIGSNCFIKSNATIGSDVFHFVKNSQKWHQFPQIGSIIIENDVWVGANTTVEKGTFKNTVLKQGVRIDDIVQIGSDCYVDEQTVVAAGSVVARNAKIGRNCWIAPNVSIRDQIEICDNVTIGMGAVVVKNISAGLIVAGNPAKELNKQKERK